MADTTIYLPQLCGSNTSLRWAFWSDELTVNTWNPDLPLCFQSSVLVYIPCGFLWLSVPGYLLYLRRQRSLHRCGDAGKRNLLKVVIGILLCFLALLNIFRTVSNNLQSYQPPVIYIASSVYLITYLLATWLCHYEYRKGQVSSGILFIFWLLMLTCQSATFRTYSEHLYVARVGVDDTFRTVTFYVTFTLTLIQFLLLIVADRTALESNMEPGGITWETTEEQQPLLRGGVGGAMYMWSPSTNSACPEQKASFLSRISYWWITGLILRGWRRPLAMKDLFDLNPTERAKHVYDQFQSVWRRELINHRSSSAEKKHRPPTGTQYSKLSQDAATEDIYKHVSLTRTLARAFGAYYMLGGLFRLLSDGLAFILPQFLGFIITFVSSDDPYQWKAYALSVLLFLASMIRSFSTQAYSDICYRSGLRLRSAVICAVYQKSLRLGSAVRRHTTQGETVNLMSVDSQRLQDLPLYVHLLWSAPLTIFGCLALLWQTLGPSALAGLFILILLIPINALIAGKVKVLQAKQMGSKDTRLKITNEILNGIKVLKLYAWEASFEQRVKDIREEELIRLRKIALLNAVTSISWFIAPFLVALSSFAVFVLSSPSHVLTPRIAFVSLSYFNIMNFPLALLPAVIAMVVQANVSITRIKKYLTLEELDEDNVEYSDVAKYAISIENGTFSWSKGEASILQNINLKIPSGTLVAVVGQVGAGKSSLISSILGEMYKQHGQVKLRGRVAYVPQTAWVLNATLQDNVIFGKQMKRNKYDRVLSSCALEMDISVLPGGDKTEIGDKGINLSGGQKQRVSLARAVYQNSDIYLLDDPLSAVDAHVGKHIFEKVIGPSGYLGDKTRILVTHSLTYLAHVDLIVCLKDGTISEMGTYKELITSQGTFAHFVNTYLQQEEEDEDQSDTEGQTFHDELRRQMSALSGDESSGFDTDGYLSETGHALRRRSHRSQTSIHHSGQMGSRKSRDMAAKRTLTSEEFTETGTVHWSVYRSYAVANGISRSLLCFLFYVLYISSSIGANIWLSIWSDDAEVNTTTAWNLDQHRPARGGAARGPTQDPAIRDERLAVYGVLGALQAAGIFGQSLCIALGSICASRIFHHSLLRRILHCPMSFFDTTPTGRIMNRVSKDIDTVDVSIPVTLRIWMMTFGQVLGTLIIISISTPAFILALLPLGVIYYLTQRFYISTSRQLKRIDSMLRSPIYSHYGTSLAGASSIRSYQQQERFIRINDKMVDQNQRAYFANIISNRWLGIMLEVLGNIIILLAATLAVYSRDMLTSGVIGLSITYALQVTSGLNYMVRMSCDMENYVVSVERILEYMNLPVEAPWDLTEDQQASDPSSSWPEQGQVRFVEFGVRYRPGMELVLSNINLTINPGEKVGIVGRTGAGKSSLTLSLFRILEAATGYISIDDRRIQELGLHTLRSRITIIPQDPVLFSGTLRSNLDPFEQFSDADIWTCLDLAHLKPFVASLDNRLNHDIMEGGENLSVGQCQLVCLARALLRRTKILVLDEATAAVDLETDELIQSTIRLQFRLCTVITIAHRLHTIMDYDRILVLQSGHVQEFASPSALLKDESSIFYGMARDAGLV